MPSQIADAVFGDSITDDKAIDLYSRAESDAYDGQQKNDAQALWSQQTTDAIAYFNSLNSIDQTTPWGAQAAAQAQAQMALAVTLAQAGLTLTDATADAQDGQEDTEWDLQESQSDTLAQLAHDQAYSDAQATYNGSLAQAAATAALAAADGYFATLPLPPGDGWGEGGFVVDESWIQGGLLANAPAPFTDSYDYLNNVDDISADGTLGWSWSVGPTTQPFMSIGNVAGSGATTWAVAVQTPYDPPNPYAGTVGWPGDPSVGSVPAGQWDENPPPVPDVGAVIYQDPRDLELATQADQAPTARTPGAVPSDGTTPAVQGPVTATRPPNPNIDGLTPQPGTRGTGVRRAAAQEVELVQKTGRGTMDWTAEEIAYIQKNGALPPKPKVDKIVGHHINSVVPYSDWAGDPRNIKFVRGQAGNLAEHGMNFHNATTGPLIDRKAMLGSAHPVSGVLAAPAAAAVSSQAAAVSAAAEGAASAAERVPVAGMAEKAVSAAAAESATSRIGSAAGKIGKPGIGAAANIGLGIIGSLAEAGVSLSLYTERARVLKGLLNQIAANGDASDEEWQQINEKLEAIQNMEHSAGSWIWSHLISYGQGDILSWKAIALLDLTDELAEQYGYARTRSWGDWWNGRLEHYEKED